MPIRLGITGLSADPQAWATKAHVGPGKSPALSEKYSVTAVAAKSHDVAKEKAYSSPEAIAMDSAVDMVVVSVKVPLHKQLSTPALEAKKDIFVEQPLGNGLAEAEELAALAKKHGVKTAVGLQTRLAPSIQKAKEIIQSEALGRITATNFNSSSTMFLTISESWKYLNDLKSGASIVSIPTGHILDTLCYLLGEFKTLNATTAITFPDVQLKGADGKSKIMKRNFMDSIAIQGILENGATTNYVFATTTDATPAKFEWIISGEKASLKFEGSSIYIAMSPPTLSQYTPAEGAKRETVEIASPMAFGGIGEGYAAFAEGRKDGLVDFDDAVKRHKMVEAIYRSAEKGTRESY